MRNVNDLAGKFVVSACACWEWADKFVDGDGLPIVAVKVGNKWRNILAAEYAWHNVDSDMVKMPRPDLVGRQRLKRTCDNPLCISPDHHIVDSGYVKKEKPERPSRLTLDERLAALVPNAEGCLLWPGAMRGGYPLATLDGYQQSIHRWLWAKEHGSIDGALVNTCGNSHCLNMAHWFNRRK